MMKEVINENYPGLITMAVQIIELIKCPEQWMKIEPHKGISLWNFRTLGTKKYIYLQNFQREKNISYFLRLRTECL